MTVYIAGKITGDPNYKEKFCKYQKELEDRGYIVLNPAMLPPSGFTYEAYLRMSSATLRECDSVLFLTGWEDSNGARQEFELAAELLKDIYIVTGSKFIQRFMHKLSKEEIIEIYDKVVHPPKFKHCINCGNEYSQDNELMYMDKAYWCPKCGKFIKQKME